METETKNQFDEVMESLEVDQPVFTAALDLYADLPPPKNSFDHTSIKETSLCLSHDQESSGISSNVQHTAVSTGQTSAGKSSPKSSEESIDVLAKPVINSEEFMDAFLLHDTTNALPSSPLQQTSPLDQDHLGTSWNRHEDQRLPAQDYYDPASPGTISSKASTRFIQESSDSEDSSSSNQSSRTTSEEATMEADEFDLLETDLFVTENHLVSSHEESDCGDSQPLKRRKGERLLEYHPGKTIRRFSKKPASQTRWNLTEKSPLYRKSPKADSTPRNHLDAEISLYQNSEDLANPSFGLNLKIPERADEGVELERFSETKQNTSVKELLSTFYRKKNRFTWISPMLPYPQKLSQEKTWSMVSDLPNQKNSRLSTGHVREGRLPDSVQNIREKILKKISVVTRNLPQSLHTRATDPTQPGNKENVHPSQDPYEEFDNCDRHPNCQLTLEEVKRVADRIPECMGVRAKVNYIRQIYKHGRDPESWNWKQYETIVPDYTEFLLKPIITSKDIPHPNCKMTKRQLKKMSQCLEYSKSRKGFVFLCFYHGLDPEETLKKIEEKPLVPWIACPEPWRALEADPLPAEVPRVKEGYYNPNPKITVELQSSDAPGETQDGDVSAETPSNEAPVQKHSLIKDAPECISSSKEPVSSPGKNPAGSKQSESPQRIKSILELEFPNRRYSDYTRHSWQPQCYNRQYPFGGGFRDQWNNPHPGSWNYPHGFSWKSPGGMNYHNSHAQYSWYANDVGHHGNYYSNNMSQYSWYPNYGHFGEGPYNPSISNYYGCNTGNERWHSDPAPIDSEIPDVDMEEAATDSLPPLPSSPPPAPPPPPPLSPQSNSSVLLSNSSPSSSTQVVHPSPPPPPQSQALVTLPSQNPSESSSQQQSSPNTLPSESLLTPMSSDSLSPPHKRALQPQSTSPPFSQSSLRPLSPSQSLALPLPSLKPLETADRLVEESHQQPIKTTVNSELIDQGSTPPGLPETLFLPAVECEIAEKDPGSSNTPKGVDGPPSSPITIPGHGQITVYIESTGYPRERLTDEQMTAIESSVLEAVLEIDEDKAKPIFDESFRSNGRFGVICQDEFSRNWLYAYLGTHKPCSDTSLRIVSKDFVEIRANAILPLCQDDSEKILNYIQIQNRRLNVNKWELVQRWNSDGMKTCLDLIIDEESAQALEKSNRIVFKMGTGKIITAKKKIFECEEGRREVICPENREIGSRGSDDSELSRFDKSLKTLDVTGLVDHSLVRDPRLRKMYSDRCSSVEAGSSACGEEFSQIDVSSSSHLGRCSTRRNLALNRPHSGSSLPRPDPVDDALSTSLHRPELLQDVATDKFRKLIASGFSCGKALQIIQGLVSKQLSHHDEKPKPARSGPVDRGTSAEEVAAIKFNQLVAAGLPRGQAFELAQAFALRQIGRP